MSELSNPRKNSRVARETIVALPHELDLDSYKSILKNYANAIVDKYSVAVDIAIHAPGQAGDHRNFHAHIYCTTQVIKEGKLGDKAEIEWSDTCLKRDGLENGKAQLLAVKKLWETCVNQEFERLGMNERIDHRFEIQGDKIPQIHVGPHGTVLARRGKGHESQEWQINQAIKAFNNVISIQDARKNLMQANKSNDAVASPQSVNTHGGIAANWQAAEEAELQAIKRLEQHHKNEIDELKKQEELSGWKPAQINPEKGAVITMFNQDAQGVYRWTKGQNEGQEAFRDTGKAIHSQTINSWALAAELELAKQKMDAGEWKEIRAFGSEQYRRAIWIQGQTMNIQVNGYSPTKEELAKYAQAPAQGLAGDEKSIPTNRFAQDQKFENKFTKTTGGNDNPDQPKATPAHSQKM